MSIGDLVAQHAEIKQVMKDSNDHVQNIKSDLKDVEEIMKKLKGMSEGEFADVLQTKITDLDNVFRKFINAYVKILQVVYNAAESLASIDKNGANSYKATKI